MKKQIVLSALAIVLTVPLLALAAPAWQAADTPPQPVSADLGTKPGSDDADEAGLAPSGTTPEDQIILDELIVKNSMCVGVDCADDESFGYDTIRLKENNLRIMFQDTSDIGSFPRNDWQIRINQSASGGNNAFYIDDLGPDATHGSNPLSTPFTIEAGAPTGALYVDAQGNVSIAGALSEASDVALKENLQPADGAAVLASLRRLPISTWNYRADGSRIRHLGPMAQDFYGAFGLGADDKHIAPLDANGVALAGLQELDQVVQDQALQIEQLRQENDALAQRVATLEALIQQILAAGD